MDINLYTKFAKDVLGVTFKDITLLVTAFTHRSYLNEHKKTVKEHNERLEFLGDAVLELVVTEYLYLNFSEPEGVMTNWRSALVRTSSSSSLLISALVNLGYKPQVAEQAADHARERTGAEAPLEALIKEALKGLRSGAR